jgi:Flp pilus assembly protein TadG
VQTLLMQVASAMRRWLYRLICHAADDVRGVAAIELAIIAPVLALMLVCTIDLGMGIYCNMRVQNAAQVGAQYAVVNGFDANAISNAVLSATNSSGLVASPTPSQFCGCATNAGITSAACTSTCPGGSTPGSYAKVSAQNTYTTLLPYPLLPRSFTFTAQSTVKI